MGKLSKIIIDSTDFRTGIVKVPRSMNAIYKDRTNVI